MGGEATLVTEDPPNNGRGEVEDFRGGCGGEGPENDDVVVVVVVVVGCCKRSSDVGDFPPES